MINTSSEWKKLFNTHRKLSFKINEKDGVWLNHPIWAICNAALRPNVLLLKDLNFLPRRFEEQKDRFDNFLLDSFKKKIAVVEIGAGVFGYTSRNIDKKLRTLMFSMGS